MSTNEYRLHDRCACGSCLSLYSEDAADTQRKFVLAGTERVYERARPFEISHIALSWTIDHEGRSLSGSAELSVRRRDERAEQLWLDAVGFDISEVSVRVLEPVADKGRERPGGWRAAEQTYDGERLIIPLAKAVRRASVRVQYRAEPRRGMYFLRPDDQVPNRPAQVWTQCQDEDARHLFPCHDKPHIRQTMDVRVQVEPGWFVLSNGQLTSSRSATAKGLFHYQMQKALPSYLFTLVAGRFAKVTGEADGVLLSYYVPEGREADAERTFARTPDMIRLFAKLTGVPYPWDGYAQIVVSDFIFGGMENTGATTMYEHVLFDERAALDVSSDDLIAHELAHQWFGDYVTCRDWSHGWLNEGFATFMEHVWREHHLGLDEYEHGLRADLQSYLAEAEGRYQRAVVCQDYKAPIDIFDRHLYEKGGLTLHALRRELGDGVFWQGVNHYLVTHADGVVETRDLQRALEAVSGRSLEQLFEQAVLRPGHPRVEVSVKHEGELLTVTVKQTLAQSARPFVFELQLDVGEGESKRVVRHARQVCRQTHTFALRAKKRPRFVVIDPELRIIGRLRIKAPADMLRHQLSQAPTGRGRVQAAELLGKLVDPATVRALGEALGNRHSFWGARAAAAKALGQIRSAQTLEILIRGRRIRHPKVRRAVMQALGGFKKPRAAELLGRAARQDESVLVCSSAASALGATRQEGAFEVLVELLEVPSWAEVIRTGAIGGLAKLRDERAVEHLIKQTAYGLPARGRRAAIAALPELSAGPQIRRLLEDLLRDETDPHLKANVALALGELGDVKARPALYRQLDAETDGRVQRRLREVLRDLGGRERDEIRRLRDELGSLRRSHDELKAHLSQLEQRLDQSQAKPKKKRAKAKRPGGRR